MFNSNFNNDKSNIVPFENFDNSVFLKRSGDAKPQSEIAPQKSEHFQTNARIFNHKSSHFSFGKQFQQKSRNEHWQQRHEKFLHKSHNPRMKSFYNDRNVFVRIKRVVKSDNYACKQSRCRARDRRQFHFKKRR